MTGARRERRVEIAARLRKLCKDAPANGRPPAGISAADVLAIADGFESLDYMVRHLCIERTRIVRAIGLQVEGPDADKDGYPDLAGDVEEMIASKNGQIAHAAVRANRAEEQLHKLKGVP